MTQYGELIAYPKEMSINEAELAILARDFNRFGALHIVLDDYNVEDSHILFCLGMDYITDIESEWAKRLLEVDVKKREALLRFSNRLGVSPWP